MWKWVVWSMLACLCLGACLADESGHVEHAEQAKHHVMQDYVRAVASVVPDVTLGVIDAVALLFDDPFGTIARVCTGVYNFLYNYVYSVYVICTFEYSPEMRWDAFQLKVALVGTLVISVGMTGYVLWIARYVPLMLVDIVFLSCCWAIEEMRKPKTKPKPKPKAE